MNSALYVPRNNRIIHISIVASGASSEEPQSSMKYHSRFIVPGSKSPAAQWVVIFGEHLELLC